MNRFFAAYLLALSWALAATPAPVLRNDRVIAFEETVSPAAMESPGDGLPSVTVFLNDTVVSRTPDGGKPVTLAVKRGDVIFRGPRDGRIGASGGTEVRLVRIEIAGAESKATWGRTGLAPDYRLLIENGYVRVYNIFVASGTSEPQHTHHNRVVVCLSGARMP